MHLLYLSDLFGLYDLYYLKVLCGLKGHCVPIRLYFLYYLIVQMHL